VKKGFTVALLGVDGAGKTTVARRLEHELGRQVSYLYMGVNPDSSNRLLPTTRLVRAVRRRRGAPPDDRGPREHADVRRQAGGGALSRACRSAKATLRLANRLAEEWYRQALSWWDVRRGRIVLFDRHFAADYRAYDVAGDSRLPLSRRIHGFFLAHVYPRPDLVIVLDAPPEVLLARKGEGTLASLARRRDEYLELRASTEHYAVVDASRPLDEVVAEVRELVGRFAQTGSVAPAPEP
jgi:thymidylate kinase